MTRRETPGSFELWTAIQFSALLFSLAHLANVVELGIQVTPGMILYVVLPNGVGAVAFGWLY